MSRGLDLGDGILSNLLHNIDFDAPFPCTVAIPLAVPWRVHRTAISFEFIGGRGT
jgi:hypothetical protein